MEVHMLLRQLLADFDPALDLSGIPDLEILGVRDDSRKVKVGDLFVARPGSKTDGAQFVADAHARGAVALVADRRIDAAPIPQICVPDTSLAASVLANLFQGSPSKKLRVIGITGTNGKTTTTYLLRHILGKLSVKCGLVGTVQIDDGRRVTESEMTTPGAVQVAELLAAMRAHGCRTCAIETSSHALEQKRVAGVEFAAGAFTNLTRDHLDYHKTMDHYAGAKAKLFESLPEGSVAVVNAQDEWAGRMTRQCAANVFTFGFSDDASYRAADVAISASGSHFVLITPDGRCEVSMPLIGRHNIENALCAAALAGEVFGLSVHQISAALKDAAGAPGRLQMVRAGQPFTILVDYAHTHDALENVLSALRPLTRGKLRVVFGCGGDRDRTKRPLMGKVAADLADAVYITSDNPRTENPQNIIDEIICGLAVDSEKSLVVEPDRRTAIEAALRDADKNDVVLIAGKGHENYQIIGATRHHFDDVEEATRVISSRVTA
jgi:UDP-N-acetylmuramoyl-L-alanyl-D-glutamate--2,6-diaminopimelate ligase